MTIRQGENIIAGTDKTKIQRNIGEIVQSTIPLTDAELHLLDGSVIQGGGVYSDFVTYISGLTSTYPDLFCSEADWQASNTAYGACDKFVYDSVNNTIRLPKRTTTHGNLIKTYSNGSTHYRIYSDGWCEQSWHANSPSTTNTTLALPIAFKDTNYTVIGALADYSDDLSVCSISAYPATASTFYALTTYSGIGYSLTCTWYACGYVDISDYQYSPIYEYIVLATSTKTSVEVDIDEIATDLNGKADIDLSNMNPTQTVKNTIVDWGMPDYSAGVSISSGYEAVSNGYIICITVWQNAQVDVYINGVKIYTCYSGGAWFSQDMIIPVSEGDVITYTGSGTQLFLPCKGVN